MCLCANRYQKASEVSVDFNEDVSLPDVTHVIKYSLFSGIFLHFVCSQGENLGMRLSMYFTVTESFTAVLGIRQYTDPLTLTMQ